MRVQFTALLMLLIPNTTANHAITYTNQNWNQSDQDQYPEMQRNVLVTGLIQNCKLRLAIPTGQIQICVQVLV